MEAFKAVLETEVPDFPDEAKGSKERILLSVDENQLWFIYLGLEHLKLVPQLKVVAGELAKELLKSGVKRYQWDWR